MFQYYFQIAKIKNDNSPNKALINNSSVKKVIDCVLQVWTTNFEGLDYK